jgi:hypothetical protein
VNTSEIPKWPVLSKSNDASCPDCPIRSDTDTTDGINSPDTIKTTDRDGAPEQEKGVIAQTIGDGQKALLLNRGVTPSTTVITPELTDRPDDLWKAVTVKPNVPGCNDPTCKSSLDPRPPALANPHVKSRKPVSGSAVSLTAAECGKALAARRDVTGSADEATNKFELRKAVVRINRRVLASAPLEESALSGRSSECGEPLLPIAALAGRGGEVVR